MKGFPGHNKRLIRRPPISREQRAAAKVGRNDPCPCRSGAKYKLCCLAFHQRIKGALR